MMINRILMELYDDYTENNNIDKLLDFARKTFTNDGMYNLFVGCVLILFSISNTYKPRYFCSRENLVSIVVLAKEKVGKGNLLGFYIERVNKVKGISKYLNNVLDDSKIDEYADGVIKYLDQFKLDLISEMKKHKNIDKYI